MREKGPNTNGNRAGAQPEIYIIVMAHLNLANETASDDNDGLFTVEQPMDLMTVNARPSRFKFVAIERKLRLIKVLILFSFAACHFINHGCGIVLWLCGCIGLNSFLRFRPWYQS